jgi:hypothetical protein
MIQPPEATLLLLALTPAFTQPTSRRFVTLLAAALLTTGRRTVANVLRTAGPLADGTRPAPIPRAAPASTSSHGRHRLPGPPTAWPGGRHDANATAPRHGHAVSSLSLSAPQRLRFRGVGQEGCSRPGIRKTREKRRFLSRKSY